MRRSSLVIAVVSLGVVVLGGHLLIRRSRQASSAAAAGDQAPQTMPRQAPAATPPPSFGRVSPGPPRAGRRAPGAALVSEMAQLRGSVVFPPGAARDPRDDLRVVAADGKRAITAQVEADGRFAIRLPPQTYSLTASAEGLTGSVDDVRAVAGETTDGIVVRLQAEASIEGKVHVRGDAGLGPRVSTVRSGTGVDSGEATVEDDGRFTVAELVAGTRYDLLIEVEGFRPMTLPEIVAPARLADVKLERLPRLRGAVGLADDGSCPADHVAVSTGGEVARDVVDESCRFDVERVPPGEEVEVAVSGPGLHLEARVPIPEHGDPEPICLNPPCGEARSQEWATLAVKLAGDPGEGGLSVSAMYGSSSVRGCGSSGDRCELTRIPAGLPVKLNVSSDGCELTLLSVTPRPGENPLVVPCRRLRDVHGVVRYAAGAKPADSPELLIRCGQDPPSRTRGRFVFSLRCPAGAGEVEWRPENQVAWRRVALAAGTDATFVEIAAPWPP